MARLVKSDKKLKVREQANVNSLQFNLNDTSGVLTFIPRKYVDTDNENQLVAFIIVSTNYIVNVGGIYRYNGQTGIESDRLRYNYDAVMNILRNNGELFYLIGDVKFVFNNAEILKHMAIIEKIYPEVFETYNLIYICSIYTKAINKILDGKFTHVSANDELAEKVYYTKSRIPDITVLKDKFYNIRHEDIKNLVSMKSYRMSLYEELKYDDKLFEEYMIENSVPREEWDEYKISFYEIGVKEFDEIMTIGEIFDEEARNEYKTDYFQAEIDGEVRNCLFTGIITTNRFKSKATMIGTYSDVEKAYKSFKSTIYMYMFNKLGLDDEYAKMLINNVEKGETVKDLLKSIVEVKREFIKVINVRMSENILIYNDVMITIPYKRYDEKGTFIMADAFTLRLSNVPVNALRYIVDNEVEKLNRENDVIKKMLYGIDTKFFTTDGFTIFDYNDKYGDYVINSRNRLKQYDEFTAINDALEKDYAKYGDTDCLSVFLSHYLINKRTLDKVFSMEEIKKKFNPKTLIDLYGIAEDLQVSIYCVDPLQNIILQYVVDRHFSRKYKSIVMCIANNHVYPIDDSSVRRSIMQKKGERIVVGDTKIKINYKQDLKVGKKISKQNFANKESIMQNIREEFPDKDYIIYLGKKEVIGKNEDYMYVINIATNYSQYDVYAPQDCVQKTFDSNLEAGTVLKHSMKADSNKITSIIFPNYKLIATPDYLESIWDTCRKLGLPIVDSFAKILIPMKDLLPPSAFNEDVKCMFGSYTKYGESIVYKEGEDNMSLDIRRAYTHALRNLDYFISIGPNEYFTDYKGEEINPSYIYFAETWDKKFLFGHNLYMGSRLIEAKKFSIEFEIKSYVKTTYRKSGKAFKSELEKILDVVDWEDQKDLINHFVGCLNKTHECKNRCNIVNESKYLPWLDERKCIYMNYNDKFNKISYHDYEEYALNYVPIRFQIVDFISTIIGIKLMNMEKEGFEITGRTVDSIQFKKGTSKKELKYRPKSESNTIGEYVLEGNKKLEFKNSSEPIIDEKFYRINRVNENKLYNGRAGTGKTTKMIKDFIEKYGKRTEMKIAVTALSWVKVMDVMKRLEAYPEVKNLNITPICLERLFSENKKYDFLLIDEMYCIPINYLYIIYKLDCIKYAAGDNNQCIFDMFSDEGEIIKEYTEVTKSLFGEIELLTTIHRYDIKLQELLEDPGRPKYELLNRISLEDSIKPGFIHITVSRKKRDAIHAMYREKNMHLLEDAPYMGTKKVRQLDIYNGTVKKYKEIKEDKMRLRMFNLSYAITNTKAIGMEYDDNIVIHEVDLMNKLAGNGPNRILYTAITRTKDYNKIFIINN